MLLYPITLESRWGTTDEFATIPFHLVLFSAASVELANIELSGLFKGKARVFIPEHQNRYKLWSCQNMCEALTYLIDNIFIILILK